MKRDDCDVNTTITACRVLHNYCDIHNEDYDEDYDEDNDEDNDEDYDGVNESNDSMTFSQTTLPTQ